MKIKKFINMQAKTGIFVSIFTLTFVKSSSQQLDTSIDKILQFLNTEATMVQTLQKYIEEQSQTLNTLKRYNADRRAKRNLIQDEYTVSTNPLNVLRFLKFLTIDFEYLEKVMENKFESLKTEMLNKNSVLFPNKTEMENAVMDLANLQRVYDITAKEVIKGDIFGPFTEHFFSGNYAAKYLQKMLAVLLGETLWFETSECSRILAENNEHELAIQWSEAGMAESANNNQKIDLLDIMIKSYLYLGDKMMALSKVRESLRLWYNNRGLMDLQVQLMTELNQFANEWEIEMVDANKACRGEFASITDKLNLKCRYNHEKSPFLKIAPIKEELLFLNPKVVVYREILYESEIQMMINISKDQLQPSTVVGKNNERKLDINYRTGQTAFLDNTWDIFKAIYERCEDFSELSMKKSEWFQVINYAPGGYYKVHSDRLQSLEETGNRMATALFYLNDVKLGGGTVFTKLNLLVKPERGSVLFWFNKAEEEYLSRHTACPVVLGEKWAFTQWFREGGQDRTLRN